MMFNQCLSLTKLSDYVKLIHYYHKDDIKNITYNSYSPVSQNISHLCGNGNDLIISYNCNVLSFMFSDNSKPLYYKEYVDGVIMDKKFENKYKMLSYKYPLINEVKSARLIEDTCGIFRTGNYTLTQSSISNKPDYETVEKLIYQTLEMLYYKW